MNEVSDPLGFSGKWFSLGLVTKSLLDEFLAEFQKGYDRNPEHYRYRAFCRYLKENDMIQVDVMKDIYGLAKSDPDYHMGGSMMAAILLRHDCPQDLLQLAKISDRKHLVKIASSKLGFF